MNKQSEIFMDYMSELNPDAIFPKGFENAIIGFIEKSDAPPTFCFSRTKCIQIIKQNSDMSTSEAEEYFDYNVLGSSFDDNAPCFLTIINEI